ncbi:MAG: phosphohydrolase, partial [Coriobacteriaceae bacterium]|nr:phosphohydrolase [Coriobacteriaceae bacterium]
GLDFGCDLALVLPVLHGPIAARELRGRYPELGDAVFSAIERHTVATCDMSPLDMVIFIADGIEPGRPATPAIERQRAEVGKVTLEELFLDALSASIGFVIETKRYLWPGALESYNRYVLDRNR